jgi:hypothetical protein
MVGKYSNGTDTGKGGQMTEDKAEIARPQSLLGRYCAHVGGADGVDFLSEYYAGDDFTESERQEIKRYAKREDGRD